MLLKDGYQPRAGIVPLLSSFLRSHIVFRELDIPIAEVVPKEVIQRLYCFMELVPSERESWDRRRPRLQCYQPEPQLIRGQARTPAVPGRAGLHPPRRLLS